MITPLHRLLAALPHPAHANSKGWQARCPVHNDDHASLSIAEGDDGRVLLNCHAGCENTAIVAAVHLEMRDLFPPRELARDEPEQTYDYRDESGAVLFRVVRFSNKRFRQCRPDGSGGWQWSLDGVRRVLYRLPDLKNRLAVFVPEGERDVDRLWAEGLPATTNSGGAGKWRDDYSTQLRAAGVERVAILPDNDPPGEAHARAVARSCHAAGLLTKIVPLAGLPPKGDVSDWLGTHSKDDLREAVRVAPPFNPSQLVTQPPKFELTSLADLLAEPDDHVEWLVQDRFPVGGVVLVVGPPKAGKSTLVRDLEYAVATRQSWLGWRTAYGAVWHCAFEERRADLRRHFRDMGATGEVPIRLFIGQGPADVLTHLSELAERERPVLITLDPLQRALRVRDLNDYAQTVLAFEPILAIARSTGATLCLVHHASMHHTRQGLDAILGSTGLAGSVDQVFVLSRHEQQRVLSSTQRVGPDLDPVIVDLDQGTGRLRLAGSKRDADEHEAAERILAALQDHGGRVREYWVKAHVDARAQDLVRGLRLLLRQGRVLRSGRGGKGDPFLYEISQRGAQLCGSRDQVISDAGSRKSGNLKTSMNPALDLGLPDSGSLVPISTYGNLNNVVENVLDSHDSGSQVPASAENHSATTPNTQDPPNEIGSDSGSREMVYERI